MRDPFKRNVQYNNAVIKRSPLTAFTSAQVSNPDTLKYWTDPTTGQKHIVPYVEVEKMNTLNRYVDPLTKEVSYIPYTEKKKLEQGNLDIITRLLSYQNSEKADIPNSSARFSRREPKIEEVPSEEDDGYYTDRLFGSVPKPPASHVVTITPESSSSESQENVLVRYKPTSAKVSEALDLLRSPESKKKFPYDSDTQREMRRREEELEKRLEEIVKSEKKKTLNVRKRDMYSGDDDEDQFYTPQSAPRTQQQKRNKKSSEKKTQPVKPYFKAKSSESESEKLTPQKAQEILDRMVQNMVENMPEVKPLLRRSARESKPPQRYSASTSTNLRKSSKKK